MRRAHDSGVVDPLFDMSNLLVTLCPLAMSECVSDCRAADGHAPQESMPFQLQQICFVDGLIEIVTGQLGPC